MKKVLITGAAGNVGLNVIRYLLAEGKYDITCLDLPNKYVYKRLKKYRKRVNIIYGDVTNERIINELVKNQDYIIHLASCLPPFSDIKKNLAKKIEVNGTENIIRAINYYNKKCMLLFASSTSVYDKSEPVSVNSKISKSEELFYVNAKLLAEKAITTHLKHYAILRLSLIIGDLRFNRMISNINNTEMVECISSEDAAYAFVKCIDKDIQVNKKILNIGGGDNCIVPFNEIKKAILTYNGISLSFINQRFLTIKDYHSPVLLDSNKSNEILKYQNDSFESICMKMKRRGKKHRISRIIGVLSIKKQRGDKK